MCSSDLLHELARDTGLLRARRRIDRPDYLDDLPLRSVGSIDERERTDDQREQRDEREEELIGDRRGEERTLVFDEALYDPARPREASP